MQSTHIIQKTVYENSRFQLPLIPNSPNPPTNPSLPSCVVRMPLSEPNVERYLEEHPGFLQKYVVSHFSETDLKELYEHWYQVRERCGNLFRLGS